MGINFCDRTAALARMILLSLLLVVSRGALAEEEASQKPEDWERQLEMLRAVPYIGFSDTVVEESDTGVVFHNPEKAYNGYNLYCTRLSGKAFLLDMEGRVVHRWTYLSTGGMGPYQHSIMMENGDLLVIKEYRMLLRFNWDSELIWKRELTVHHDVTPASDGSFYVIDRELRDHRGKTVWFEAVVHLSAKGAEIDRWSTYDHLEELKSALDTRSFLDTVLDSLLVDQLPERRALAMVKSTTGQSRQKKVDYFHTNTVSLLPATLLGEEDSRFRQGNLLVCFRNANQIAVLEKDTYRVLWAWGEGELQWPHHPTMLSNGHILIFDNGVKRNYSRVVELDPIAGSIVWEYVAQPPEDFYSSGGGSAQRLPNGNTLICETNAGRVFEVTREGEVVWEWLNSITKEGRREVVYRMLRLPPALVEGLLQKRGSQGSSDIP